MRESSQGLATCLLLGLVRQAKVTRPFPCPSSSTWDSALGDLIHNASPRDSSPSTV